MQQIHTAAEKAWHLIQKARAPEMFCRTEFSKTDYLDIMELIIASYSERLPVLTERYAQSCVEDIHTFSRLASTLGGLLSNGRRQDDMALWQNMMDVCCRDVATVTEGLMPDFAVKELMLAYRAMKGAVPTHRAQNWWKGLKQITPEANYGAVLTKKTVINNIGIYNMAGEYLREQESMTEVTAYFRRHWPEQLEKFDENGMYVESGAPMLYDLSARVQIQLILDGGYQGEFFQPLDACLEKGGRMSLLMQSAAGQIPYGGRSNQYLFNEALLAANCEYEARRYWRRGDAKTAGMFKRAAHLAVASLNRWLGEEPLRHIKNFYPVQSGIGTEPYGYYEKYMITLGSFLYLAYLFADESIPESPCPAEMGGYVLETSKQFHKVFANCMGTSVEIDTKADGAYDATGLGRIQKNNAAAELGCAMPFARLPNYQLPPQVEANIRGISLSPGWAEPEGRIRFLSELTEEIDSKVVPLCEDRAGTSFQIVYTGNAFRGCRGVAETYLLDRDGLQILVDAIAPKDGQVFYQLPLLESNGKEQAEIVQIQPNVVHVCFKDDCYEIETDGHIERTGERCWNRNGVYQLGVIQKQGNTLLLKLRLKKKDG